MQYYVNFKQTEFKDENFHPKVTQPADIRHRLCVENRLAVEKNGVFCQTLYISLYHLNCKDRHFLSIIGSAEKL